MSGGAVVLGLFGAAGVGTAIILAGSMYTIDEGHVGVITDMGKAIRQEGPNGLQFKTPILEGVREFDVRERTITSTTNGTTNNQLSTNLAYSVNWRPVADRVMEIYVNYGSPEEFATNVITPRINQAVKAAIGSFSGTELAKERQKIADAMLEGIRVALEGYPATFESAQLDDYTLPDWYWTAIRSKEEQREATQKSLLALEQQNNEAQREVQSAQAAADARKAAADAQAYETKALAEADAFKTREQAAAYAEATKVQAEADAEKERVVGEAKAMALEAQGRAISSNPGLVEWRFAESWTGGVPSMIMGGDATAAPILPIDLSGRVK